MGNPLVGDKTGSAERRIFDGILPRFYSYLVISDIRATELPIPLQSQHERQILHGGARRALAEIVEPGDEDGLPAARIGADEKLEVVGAVERLRLDAARLRLFSTRIWRSPA